MPEWIVSLGPSIGGAGAILLLGALVSLHYGYWYPRSTVRLLETRVAELTSDLVDERKEHRADVAEAERRLFNALGVADKVTSMVEHVAVRRRAS